MSRSDDLRLPRTATAQHRASVVQRARLRLSMSPYPALRRLDCHYHEGVLTVRGRVSSFHERQMAWITLCDLMGIEEFVDRVEVVEPKDAPDTDA